jgi:hypothetical protein
MNQFPATSLPEVLFDADLFVNRVHEQQRVLDMIRSPTSSPRFLEFQGIAGQGKSELLKWIYHQAELEGYCAAYLDFESSQYYRTTLDPLLETIAGHLQAHFTVSPFTQFWDELPAYRELLQASYLARLELSEDVNPEDLETLEQSLIQAFHDGIRKILETHNVVLCLDSTERAYPRILNILEEQIMGEYLEHPGFMLITAGQHPVVWSTVRIKDRIQRCELSRLNNDAIQHQLQCLAGKLSFTYEEGAAVADKILQVTLGHPYSAYKMITLLTADHPDPLTTTRVDEKMEYTLTLLVEHVIEERILTHCDLDGEYPPVKDMLWYLAPLRHIEMSTFRYVLSTFLKNWFGDKNFIVFEQLAGDFQQTAIFTEWRLGNGFNMDPLVRHLLLSNMQINDMEQYLDMQEQLSHHYDALVAQTQDATQIKNMVERLYHYAVFLWGTQPNSVNGTFQEAVQEYLDTYFSIQEERSAEVLRDQAGRLYRALKNDEELGNLVNIVSVLGQIEEHRNGLAA